MEIDCLTPVILIPWDQVFKDPLSEKHVITLTSSMGDSLDAFSKNPAQGIIHGPNSIRPSCFYDECLTYEDIRLELIYESAQKLVRDNFEIFGIQQWIFANRFLLKEFQGFFRSEEVQYLEPAHILKPYTMFISEKDNGLFFSYPKSAEYLLCSQ